MWLISSPSESRSVDLVTNVAIRGGHQATVVVTSLGFPRHHDVFDDWVHGQSLQGRRRSIARHNDDAARRTPGHHLQLVAQPMHGVSGGDDRVEQDERAILVFPGRKWPPDEPFHPHILSGLEFGTPHQDTGISRERGLGTHEHGQSASQDGDQGRAATSVEGRVVNLSGGDDLLG
ncbi:hypothetical protein PG987_002264 [Apiospora arundinis]